MAEQTSKLQTKDEITKRKLTKKKKKFTKEQIEKAVAQKGQEISIEEESATSDEESDSDSNNTTESSSDEESDSDSMEFKKEDRESTEEEIIASEKEILLDLLQEGRILTRDGYSGDSFTWQWFFIDYLVMIHQNKRSSKIAYSLVDVSMKELDYAYSETGEKIVAIYKILLDCSPSNTKTVRQKIFQYLTGVTVNEKYLVDLVNTFASNPGMERAERLTKIDSFLNIVYDKESIERWIVMSTDDDMKAFEFFEPYQIRNRTAASGQGSQACVYKVTRKIDNKEMIVKIVPSITRDRLGHFEKEYEIQKVISNLNGFVKLEHETRLNCFPVNLFDPSRNIERRFLVLPVYVYIMPYIPFRLDDILHLLKEHEKYAILFQIVFSLREAAQKYGFSHNDIIETNLRFGVTNEDDRYYDVNDDIRVLCTTQYLVEMIDFGNATIESDMSEERRKTMNSNDYYSIISLAGTMKCPFSIARRNESGHLLKYTELFDDILAYFIPFMKL